MKLSNEIIQPFSVFPLFFWLLCFLVIVRILLIAFPSFRLLEDTGRYRQLDGLRGILALGVFFHHGAVHYQFAQNHQWAAPPSLFYAQIGAFSVRLFFFLSGFLFWSKLIQSGGKLSLGKYFSARFWRVVPASWVSIGAICFIAFFETHFKIEQNISEMVQNVVKWMVFGLPLSYFPPINNFQDTYLINAWVCWTLAQEWMFYLIFPAMAWFSKGNRLFLLIVGIGTIFIYFTNFNVVAKFKATEWVQYVQGFQDFLSYLLNGFCFGMVAAWVKSRYRGASNFRSPIFSFISILCLAVICGWSLNSYIVSTCLFVFFTNVVLGNSLFGLLETESFVFLGRISFSVYLFHGIVLWILRGVESLDPIKHWLFVGTAGMLTLLVATFVYRNVEYPLVRKKH